MLRKTITYFENHRHMMGYGEYLAKGYPVASGLIEGACNSLVNDRMEQSGTCWSLNCAEAMLQQTWRQEERRLERLLVIPHRL